jgi:large subunit ribosomal protein L22
MGIRKKQMADAIKADKKQVAFAKLNNCPTSPRKMRLVADLVRGQKAEKALQILRFSPKEASRRLEKLLLSAIANWQSKNEDADIESADLFVKEIRVAGRNLFNIDPPSTLISFTNKSADSISASSFLDCQLAIAESKSFSRRREASFGLNLNICRAFSAFCPLTKSATKRIFLGEVGQLLSLAKATCFLSALIASAICFLRIPIALVIFYLYFLPQHDL